MHTQGPNTIGRCNLSQIVQEIIDNYPVSQSEPPQMNTIIDKHPENLSEPLQKNTSVFQDKPSEDLCMRTSDTKHI